MTARQNTRQVKVGKIRVGGGAPITIQSMTTTDTRDISATAAQIRALQEAGCEIIRVAVPDMAAARAIAEIKPQISIPLVADIHFDYRLALEAVRCGADKLRINPGNIGDADNLRQVAKTAKQAGIPIRVGVNGGSLEKDLYEKYGLSAEALCESLLRHVRMLEECDFGDIVLSVKVSDVPLTLAAHRLVCERLDYPLHVGITESGTAYRGRIKSAAGIGALLAMGIGDTIRVSLTGDPLEEIKCAKMILEAMNLRRFGPQIISCPTCGRCEVNLAKIAEDIEAFCEREIPDKPITVAVMGCVVNGPGEAREADYGIACGKSGGVIFAGGEVVGKVPADGLVEGLAGLLNSVYGGAS